MSAPTKADKAYWSRLAHEVGCIACRLDDGVINRRVSIHHINGRTKPGAHRQVLPLCGPHHQTGGTVWPSVHPWKKRFEMKYGKQSELKKKCDAILEENARSLAEAMHA